MRWSGSLHHHHKVEEKEFFPSIEKLAGTPGLMAARYEQQCTFTPGFDGLDAQARTCQPRDLDGGKVRELVDGFAQPLTRRLHDEIENLRALKEYDSEQVRQAYRRLGKLSMDTDNKPIAPLVFGTADRNFEVGMHEFPSVPFFVPYVIHYVFGRQYRGASQSNSTAWRDRKDLGYPDPQAA